MISRLRARPWGIAPALVAAALGFFLALDLRVQDAISSEETGRRDELARIAATRQARTSELEQRVATLRARLDALAARAGGRALDDLRAQIGRLEALVGGARTQGPGLLVTLRDAEGSATGLDESDTHIQDVDLQTVVNELWAAGAEAISINDHRLVSTTAIRNAGGAVLVNFRVLTSPYRVAAVGSAPSLHARFAASATAKRFARWVEIYGLGFTFETRSRLMLPAYAGFRPFSEARPIVKEG